MYNGEGTIKYLMGKARFYRNPRKAIQMAKDYNIY